jgi:uncharacterized protein YjiK
MGKLFYLGRDTRAIMADYDFAEKGDYEDIALYNGVPYILRSDGALFRFDRDSMGKGKGVNVGQLPITGTNDFETLYADPSRNALILLCKTCSADDEKTVSAYAYFPDSLGFEAKPIFKIDADAVAKLSPFKSTKFEPSAAAINPVLHKLFILSSTSRQLAITDLDGKVESVFKLSSKLFPQPEGIAFKQNGDLFITNEGGTSKASLLIFSYYKDTNTSTTATRADAPKQMPFDLGKPDETMQLGDHLHEISGMAYIPQKDLILGENDEKGDIFVVDYKNKNDKVEKIKFGGKGDYEDIVYTDTAVYMLISSGTIVRVDSKDSSFNTTDFVLEKGGNKNEFETMYLDKADRSIILLCKQCSKEKEEVRNAYRFDLTTNTFSTEPLYTINISSIREMLKDDQASFKPSAGAIDPITGKLYIVASVGKLLVVASKDGKVEQVFRLDPAIYNQPEGMTFAPNGDLYISNEGGEGIATILYFKRK